MKWLKRKDNQTPNSYWDTISDVMSSLLLVLMLVMVLLILYVVRAPNYNKQQEIIPESVIIIDGTVEQYVDRDAGHAVLKVDVPYFLPGMEDEEYGRGELTDDFLYEIGGYFDDEFDGHEGAAVRVIVEDAETHSAILAADTAFSLYSSEGRLRPLHTFYPNLTIFTKYETDSSGTFYLPEKLPLASYILHELTVPDGYEKSEDVVFTLEEPHPWTEPYVLHVPLVSVRNTVLITAFDNITKEPVMGCVFEIVAAEDITTPDGTLRYPEGTVVDEIACDEEGMGRSIALYLGEYEICQIYAPDYYAVDKERYHVTLGGLDGDELTVEQVILCEKTRFALNVVDELYRSMPVSGAEFSFESENGTTQAELITDENGTVVIDALDKQTVYTLKQTGAPEGYQLSDEIIEFYVDENGRIEDSANYAVRLTNRTLRLAVFVEDALFHKAASGCRVSLFDENNNLVKAWDSTNLETTVEGLHEGSYRIEISGAASLTENVTVTDTAAVQNVSCSVWTTGNKVMIAGCAIAVCGIGLVAFMIFKRIKKRK